MYRQKKSAQVSSHNSRSYPPKTTSLQTCTMQLPSMTSQLKMDQESIIQYFDSTSPNSTQPSNLFELQPNLTDRSIGITQTNHTLGVLQSFLLKTQESKNILLHLPPGLQCSRDQFLKSIIFVELIAASIVQEIQLALTTSSKKKEFRNSSAQQRQVPNKETIFNKPEESLNKLDQL